MTTSSKGKDITRFLSQVTGLLEPCVGTMTARPPPPCPLLGEFQGSGLPARRCMQPLTGAATLKEKWPKRPRPVRTAWPTSRSAPRRPTPVTTCNFPGPRRQPAEANLHDLPEPLESHAVALYRGGLAVHPSSSSPVYPQLCADRALETLLPTSHTRLRPSSSATAHNTPRRWR